MTKSPRILALIFSRVMYGQERANLLVLETLKDAGHEILAVVEDQPWSTTMPKELERLGIPFVYAPIIGRRAEGYLFDFLVGNPVRYGRFRTRMKAVLRDFRPTHIHVPNPFAFILADAISTRDLPIIYRIGDKPATHNLLWRFIWRRITRNVLHFVADSEFIRNQLQTLGVAPDRVSVIFTPPAKRSTPPRPDLQPSHPQHILFIGQLNSSKGIDLLIGAFRKVATEFPEAVLTVVGRLSDWSGDDWARNLRESTLSDTVIGHRVAFVGEQQDIYGFLASAAFVVVPSVIEEAFGLVVGEAKIAARPCVVFPSGGLPEQVRHLENAYICSGKNIDALAEGLRYYLSDPARVQTHAKNALESLSQLGAHRFAESWQAVYQRVHEPQ